MATPKEYAYYIKGNKVGIVEKNTSFNNDPNSRNYGPGAKDIQWESPLSSVTDGLEIEYSYSPIYTVQSTGTIKTDVHKFLGWGSNGENLLLFTQYANMTYHSPTDLSSYFAADDWIYIASGDWKGLHQVKSQGGTTGILTLKTKFSLRQAKVEVNVNRYAGSTSSGTWFPPYMTGNGITNDESIEYLIETFEKRGAGQDDKNYIFLDGADEDNESNGFYAAQRGVYEDQTGGSHHGNIQLNIKYFIQDDYGSEGDLSGTGTDTHGDFTYIDASSGGGGIWTNNFSDSDDDVVIYRAFRENMYVHENVVVMEDESFELDLPRYLSRAVEFYMRAKIAEAGREIDLSLYYMREFKKQVEKHNTSKGSSFRQIQGFWGLR